MATKVKKQKRHNYESNLPSAKYDYADRIRHRDLMYEIDRDLKWDKLYDWLDWLDTKGGETG